MIKGFWDFFNILFYGRSFYVFFVACVVSFGFSLAVILSTIGIMDGFVETLKSGLRLSNGDFSLTSRDGFFEYTKNLKETLQDNGFDSTPIIQTEGFALVENQSTGVIVKGVVPSLMKSILGTELSLSSDEIVIGKELAEKFQLGIGDFLVLALAQGNEEIDYLPQLHRLKVSQILDHQIYEKNLRLVYLDQGFLRQILTLGDKINLVLGIHSQSKQHNSEWLVSQIDHLRSELNYEFNIRPFWSEYGGLLKAVEIEKKYISLILQVFVIVAIFNFAAFNIYLLKRKSRDLFLLRAIGLGLTQLKKYWACTMLLTWIFSCGLSLVLVWVFDVLILGSKFLKIPGDIYFLSRLHIQLSWPIIALIFVLALVWMAFINIFWFRNLNKKSVLYGLREEFI